MGFMRGQEPHWGCELLFPSQRLLPASSHPTSINAQMEPSFITHRIKLCSSNNPYHVLLESASRDRCSGNCCTPVPSALGTNAECAATGTQQQAWCNINPSIHCGDWQHKCTSTEPMCLFQAVRCTAIRPRLHNHSGYFRFSPPRDSSAGFGLCEVYNSCMSLLSIAYIFANRYRLSIMLRPSSTNFRHASSD